MAMTERTQQKDTAKVGLLLHDIFLLPDFRPVIPNLPSTEADTEYDKNAESYLHCWFTR